MVKKGAVSRLPCPLVTLNDGGREIRLFSECELLFVKIQKDGNLAGFNVCEPVSIATDSSATTFLGNSERCVEIFH
jgi:hypothetical protein